MTAMVFIRGRIKGQNVAFVLQQSQAFQSPLEGHGPVRDRIRGVGRIPLRPVEEAVAQRVAENAQHLVVDGGFLHRAVLDGGQQGFGVHEACAGHFQVEAVVGRGHAVVGGVPVRHQHALEAPLALEHLEVEEFVLGGVRAVDQVVGVHDRVDVSFGDGGFEGGQVDFAHGALVGGHVDVVAVVLLVVEGVMLDGGDDTLRLDALDVGDHHARIEKWIFRQIFEVASGDGRAGDVDARAEQKVHAAGAGILAQALAQFAGEVLVPGGGQRHAAGIGSGGSPGAHAH